MRKLRILYAGSPLASSLVLKELLSQSSQAGWEIAAVLTNPPSPRGRHKELIPTEVEVTAREAGLPVFAFDHLTGEAREAIAPVQADILLCFDFGRIFGPKFLGLFPLGGINLHPSALPKYRGCTPVPAAILNGDKKLGISVQKLALKTDEGDILAFSEVPLDGSETTLSLMDGDGKSSLVTDEGSKLLVQVLNQIAETSSSNEEKPFTLPEGKPQEGESSYTPFIKKEDGIIDWNLPAEEICRRIRAYTPWPLCSTTFDGQKLTILKARVAKTSDGADVKTSETAGLVLPYEKGVGVQIACGGGSVLVATELQLQGKKAMDYKSFMNGARNFDGSHLA